MIIKVYKVHTLRLDTGNSILFKFVCIVVAELLENVPRTNDHY